MKKNSMMRWVPTALAMTTVVVISSPSWALEGEYQKAFLASYATDNKQETGKNVDRPSFSIKNKYQSNTFEKMIFEMNSENREFLVLSEVEMRETQGAYLSYPLYWHEWTFWGGPRVRDGLIDRGLFGWKVLYPSGWTSSGGGY